MKGRLLVLLLAVVAVTGCAGSSGGDGWSVGPRTRCAGERSDPATSAQVILFCAQSP